MKIEITDQERCKKQLKLEIPGDAVRAQVDKAAATYARQVVIPGFRRGHVPVSIVKTRFRKGLREEAASQLVPKAIEEAFAEKGLKALGEPSIEEFKFDDDETIHLTIVVETLPEFQLAGYKGIPLTKPIYETAEEHIDKRIEQMREEQAEMVPVEDRGAQIGDVVTVDLTGQPMPDDEPATSQGSEATDDARSSDEESPEPQKTESQSSSDPVIQKDLDIELRSEGVVKEFTQALEGARVGERRTFVVNYPEDYPHEEFAGRRVSYDVEVTGVRVKELPEINDDFAQSVSEEHDTLEKLRANISSDLEKENEALTENELRSRALEQLVDRNRFDLPESLLNKQIGYRINNFAQNMLSQGVDPRQLEIDWEDFQKKQQEGAERDLRGLLILTRIAEAENIEASDEDVEKEIELLADRQQSTPEVMKARLTKDGGLDSIKEQVRNRKALDFVIASADIRTEKADSPGQLDSD